MRNRLLKAFRELVYKKKLMKVTCLFWLSVNAKTFEMCSLKKCICLCVVFFKVYSIPFFPPLVHEKVGLFSYALCS